MEIKKDKLNNYEVNCLTCGKPITVSNKYGLFCEDLHGMKESKAAVKKLEKLFGFKLFK